VTAAARSPRPRVAMLTYSTKPRGGVVHALHLAEGLWELGWEVHVFALGDPAVGFYRPLRVPHTILPAPGSDGTLEDKVARSIAAFADGLAGRVGGRFDVLHAQDCIAAGAALAVRAQAEGLPVVRTVHHVDDFTSQALIECQLRSILHPDHVLVVSEDWRRRLSREFGVRADVVTNGVERGRFERTAVAGLPERGLRERAGVGDRFLFLTVGGVEPRKGSLELVEALSKVRARVRPAPVLAVVGGHSFRDYTAYADGVRRRAAELGVAFGDAIVQLGTVTHDELPGWYHAADGFVFPSVKEGWGLVLLEAMAAGLPVVTSDIPVFREFLTDEDALLVPPRDPEALAGAMVTVACDPGLRRGLARRGPLVAARFTWRRCAEQHAEIYARIA
jgi:glycosyltransferase-like protein